MPIGKISRLTGLGGDNSRTASSGVQSGGGFSIGGFLNDLSGAATTYANVRAAVRGEPQPFTSAGATEIAAERQADNAARRAAAAAQGNAEFQTQLLQKALEFIPQNVRDNFAQAGENVYISDVRRRLGENIFAYWPVWAGGILLFIFRRKLFR